MAKSDKTQDLPLYQKGMYIYKLVESLVASLP